jgi:hypothetical protein
VVLPPWPSSFVDAGWSLTATGHQCPNAQYPADGGHAVATQDGGVLRARRRRHLHLGMELAAFRRLVRFDKDVRTVMARRMKMSMGVAVRRPFGGENDRAGVHQLVRCLVGWRSAVFAGVDQWMGEGHQNGGDHSESPRVACCWGTPRVSRACQWRILSRRLVAFRVSSRPGRTIRGMAFDRITVNPQRMGGVRAFAICGSQ